MNGERSKRIGESERLQTIELTDGELTVTVTQVVSMGELLLIECRGEQLRLDAMLLEGISWQTAPDGLAEFTPNGQNVLNDPISLYENELRDPSESFTIANEYTTVEIGKVDNTDTTALQVKSKKGATVLGPQTLAALTGIESTRSFSKWFRTPIGPEEPL